MYQYFLSLGLFVPILSAHPGKLLTVSVHSFRIILYCLHHLHQSFAVCTVSSFHGEIQLIHSTWRLILHHDNPKVACEYARRPNKAIQLPHQSLAPKTKTLLHHATTPQSHPLLHTITYSLSKPRTSPSCVCCRRPPQQSFIGS